MMRIVPEISFAVFFVVLAAADVQAQATRTWVSGVGDDANPCSRTAPCKTFAGAIAKTAANGEIDALDPGAYGAVTITKGMTINGGGMLASVLATASNGIVVSGAGIHVTLRDLDVIGGGTGLDGISIQDAATVTIENCTIHNFTGDGISVTAPGARLFVRGTSIHDVAAGSTDAGIAIAPSSGSARAVIDDVHVNGATYGISVGAHGAAVVRHTDVSGNGAAGILASGSDVDVDVADLTAAMNDVGILADGGAIVRTTRVLVAGNASSGMSATNGGILLPFVENQVTANPAAGATATCDLPTAVVACPATDGAGCPACPDVNVPACPEVPACPNVDVPACPAAQLNAHVGPCRKCRTRGGITTCTSCTVTAQ